MYHFGRPKPQPQKGQPILVAVYGTLRRTGGLHKNIQHCRFIGQGIVSGADMYSFIGCPGVVIRPDQPDHKIVVEVYEVDEATLFHLDMIEGGYDREMIKVTLDSGKEIKSWIYSQSDREVYNCDRVESGDWIKYELVHPWWESKVIRGFYDPFEVTSEPGADIEYVVAQDDENEDEDEDSEDSDGWMRRILAMPDEDFEREFGG